MRLATTIPLTLPLLLLTLVTAQAQVQPTFNVAPEYFAGFPVAIADFNQDGNPDIVSALSTLLGNGDGTFRTGTRLNVTLMGQYDIFTADFNRDGKPDIAFFTPTGQPQPILIFLGKGDGTFQSPLSITPVSVFTSVVVADVNNDGNPDLVTVDGGALVVYLGKGDGTFTRLAPNFTQSVQVVADVNGDGKPDILWFNNGTNVNVALGNGDGTFQSPPLVSAMPGSVFAVADFNNDGKLDLGVLAPTCCTYTVGVQFGNGDGTFQTIGPQTSIPPGTPIPPGGPLPGMAAGDINGDGNVDVAYALTGPIIGMLIGNGDGTFSYGNSYALGNYSGPNGIAMADLNRDGKLDIVEGQLPGLNDSILLGNGDGTFAAAPALPVSPLGLAGYGTVTADFNGDGKPDVAMLGPNGISIFLDTANGLAQENQINSEEGVGPVFFAAADLINNGKQDLFVGNTTVLLGNGDGTFQPAMTISPCGSPPSGGVPVQGLGDFNGDHIPDIISTGDGYLFICLGKGDGTFGAPTQYLAGSGPGVAAIGDFNGDGKLDVAVGNPNGVDILLGNGDGTFRQPTLVQGNQIVAIAVADVNLDGKLDLITTQSSSPGLQVYLGKGDGTFSAVPPQKYPGEGMGPIVVSDLNGDGKPDFIIFAAFEGTLCLGNGDGTFNCELFVYANNANYGGGVIADFNGDERPDIAVLSSYALSVLTNTTAEEFTMAASPLSPSSASPGGSAMSTVTIAPIFGFNTSVTLSCSSITLNGSPATTDPPACSFNPATLPGGSGTSTLTVSTTGATAMLSPDRTPGLGLSYAMWLPISAIALAGAGTARRKRMMFALLLSLALCSLVLLPACGGGGSSSSGGGGGGGGSGSSGTPAATYTITVKASASGFQPQTTTVTLTVK